MIGRIITNVGIVVSIFFFPWWITIAVVVMGVIMFPKFYEAIIAGVFMDILYGTQTVQLFGFTAVFTVAFLLGYVVWERFKKNIRFYVS